MTGRQRTETGHLPLPIEQLQAFPFPTRLVRNPVAGTVGTTATQVLRNNPKRVAWLIVNRSANLMDLEFNPENVGSNAIPLKPDGGFASADIREDGELVLREVWMSAGAALSRIGVFEVERI